MKEQKKKDPKKTKKSQEEVSRRTFLSKTGKTVLLTASYLVISVFADKVNAAGGGREYARCTGCTSGATTVYPGPCTSCTACISGCTGCTKWCTSGCCISCTRPTK